MKKMIEDGIKNYDISLIKKFRDYLKEETELNEMIKEIIDNIIEFNSSSLALFSEINGGENVIIGKVLNTIEGYPDANNYTISLKKTFTDVISLTLVSSEFPYVQYNVTKNNNKLYWKFLEDGDYIYSTTILEGNYYIDSLVSILKSQMN